MQGHVRLAQRFAEERPGVGVEALQVEVEPPLRLVPGALRQDAQPLGLEDLVGGARRAGHRHQGDVEADAELAAQGRDGLQPQPVAGEAEVLVAGVFVDLGAELVRQGRQGRPPRAQERPHQQVAVVAAAEPACLRDAGEAVRAGAPQHAEQHRFEIWSSAWWAVISRPAPASRATSFRAA